jgi:hypothetical protein
MKPWKDLAVALAVAMIVFGSLFRFTHVYAALDALCGVGLGALIFRARRRRQRLAAS